MNLTSKDMDRIVKFTLDKHSVKANGRISPLTYNKWKKFSKEKTFYDGLAWGLGEKIKKLMDRKEVRDWLQENEDLKKQAYEALEMEKEIEKEYGRVLTLEENLCCNAITIVKPKTTLKGLKMFRGKVPVYYKLMKKSKDADFVILLNVQLISGDPRREKLKTLVHETLHFIQYLKKMRTDFESIEGEAEKIVGEFLVR